MSETKRCPFCAEEIQAAAIKCKHCESMLEDAAPVESVTSESPSIPPTQPIFPSTTEPEEKLESEITSSESPQEPDKKQLFKIAIKSIQNDKVKFDFGKQLHEKLKIPRARLNDLLVPGKSIVQDLDMEQAEKSMEDLSVEGIELAIKPQLSSEDKKLFWAVILMLISIIVGIWSMKFKSMNEPKYKSPAELCMPEYNKCKGACYGDHECLIACNELVWQPCMDANRKE